MKLPEVTAWSYSRYGLYKQCPAKFKYKHLEKLPDPSGPAAERGNYIHKLAEDVIQGKKKLHTCPDLKYVETEVAYLTKHKAIAEQEWAFKRDWSWTGRPRWFGDDVWVRIKADAVLPYDDNTGLGVDWKTGRRYDTHQEQAELTGLLMLMRYPDMTTADVRFWYVDEPAANNELQIIIERSDVAALQKDWERKVTPMFKDKKFAPKPNQWCGRCAFSKSNGGPCKF